MIYIIVDASNLFFRSRYVTQDDDPELKCGMGLNIILTSIRKVWKKFKGSHVVFALDGRSWRKDIYSRYKITRAMKEMNKSQEEKDLETFYFSAMKDFTNFLTSKTNCTVLSHPRLEADDLISGWINQHPNDEHFIISSDTDFYQLLNKNVNIYDGMKSQIITLDGFFDDYDQVIMDNKTKLPRKVYEPEWLLFEKCIRGDSTDSIFTAFPRVRRKTLLDAYEDRHAKGFLWNNLMLQTWVDHEGIEHIVRDDYERNRILIDLNAQPDEIKEIIKNVINLSIHSKEKRQVGSHFVKFCSKWQLINIIDIVTKQHGEFTDFLSAEYSSIDGVMKNEN